MWMPCLCSGGDEACEERNAVLRDGRLNDCYVTGAAHYPEFLRGLDRTPNRPSNRFHDVVYAEYENNFCEDCLCPRAQVFA